VSDVKKAAGGEGNGPSVPLASKVKEWLLRAGYPLEMRVAREFHKAGMTQVVQSEFYETKNENGYAIYREIDVAAQVGAELYRPHPVNPTEHVHIFFDFYFAVECKTTKGDKPWVVFSDPKTLPPDRAFFYFHPMSEHARMFMIRLHQDGRLHHLPFFGHRQTGYSAACAMLDSSSNEDRAYKAITGVLSAATAKAQAAHHYYTMFRIAIPIVVITQPLFESFLDPASGELKVEPRDEMPIYWRNPGVGQTDSLVYILTEAALPGFIARAKEAFEAVQSFEEFMMLAVRYHAENRPSDPPASG
jgi:hypothetical protein